MGSLLGLILGGSFLLGCLTFEDPDPLLVERDRLLGQAERSLAEAGRKVKDDPARPIFHLLPPGNWMNDPNGPVLFKGSYHLFHQLNPYGDRWGDMHWGHFRSDDLVHWRDEPIALWPTKSRGEEHCFSGSAVVRPDGRLMIFYTSIGNRAPEQWAAISEDDEARVFRKHPASPLLTLKDHGDLKIDDWRDPYVFPVGTRWFMVIGGHRAGGKGGILLYQSDDLDHWTFRGIAHEGVENNWECPNLIRIGERWVLIYSPHGPVRYKTGTLDLTEGKFTAQVEGVVDPGNYYAPNGLNDASGRHVLWGWINGFPEGQGWNGCLTLPRVLGLTSDGRLTQQPLPQLQKLRGERLTTANLNLDSSRQALGSWKDTSWEISLTVARRSAHRAVLSLLPEGSLTPALELVWQGDKLLAGGSELTTAAKNPQSLGLRIFRDRGVVEVFTDDGQCLTKVVAAGDRPWSLAFSADGGQAEFRDIQRWPMRTIWTAR